LRLVYFAEISHGTILLFKEIAMTVREHHSTKALLALSRSESNKRLAQRIQVIAWAQKGMTCPDIVQISNHSRRSIQAWVAAYNADGIEALRDKPRPGRNPLLAHNKQIQLCRRIDAGASCGRASLGGNDIRQILKDEFGVIYTLDGVYKLLHRLGYSCLCPRPQHENADPDLQEEFKKTS
jgi:transposase